MSKTKSVLFYFLFFIIFFSFSCLVTPFSCDEIWNFGFSYNISNGLIPYRDFNLLQTPFYFFINSFLLILFGKNICVMYMFNAVIATISLYFVKKINSKSFYFIASILLLFSLVAFFPNYNLFCMYLFIILFYLQKYKHNSFLVGLITGIIFITKQNIGLCLFIPIFLSIFTSFKEFLKGLFGFLVPIIILILYLVFNNSLFDFVNYSFLGLFDFSSHNSKFGLVFLIEIFVLVYLIYMLLNDKSNFRDYLYLICFQVICYPIFDLNHCLLAFIPVLIYLTRNKELNHFSKYVLLFTLLFFILFMIKNYNKSDTKYFKYRNHPSTLYQVNSISKFVSDYSYKYDIHIISYNSYFYKLESGLPIDEFDLLLYGNLGYGSYDKYLSIINSSDRDILFIMSDTEYLNNQLHNEICEYIIKNSIVIDELIGYKVYKFEVNK